MDMDIEQIIKERYQELPTDIQRAIQSNDLAGKFDLIAQKHNLHVDQNGSLQTETVLVMLGLESSKKYVSNLERELEIPHDKALAISEDVNREILMSIRDSLRKMEEEQEKEEVPQPENINKEQTLSTIEQVGQFTLERNPQSTSPQYKEQGISKEALLTHIEDKEDHRPITLTDHLLSNPVMNPEKKVEARVEVVPKVEVKKDMPVPEVKKYGADPYREPLV